MKSVKIVEEENALRIYNQENELLRECYILPENPVVIALLEAIAFAEGALDETPRINPFVPAYSPHKIILDLSYFLTSNLKNAIAAALSCPGSCHEVVHRAYNDGQGAKSQMIQ